MTYDVRDIDTKGYAIVRNFLDVEERKTLTEMYWKKRNAGVEYNPNYQIITTPLNIQSIISKLMVLKQNVNEQTGSTVDMIPGVIEFAHSDYINYAWHQEHESYYALQKMRDFFRIWTPLVKEHANQSGMHFIPNNVLKEQHPEIAEMLHDRGASQFYVEDGKTRYLDDEIDEEKIFDFNLFDMAETPDINAGDMVIFRGDVIHKTQDVDTKRLASVFKFINSQTIISKERFFKGGVMKNNFLNANDMYEKYRGLFEHKDEITLSEFMRGIK
jgi:ectoine hydroxylase-related dioxygenase (phytanoyl-CoA dioxygenase family)